jgi:beta-aspartyl-peptidase (threonine type)
MGKITIAVHGGAGPDSGYIRENKFAYEAILKKSLEKGYQLLQNGKTAVDAVEAAIQELEDDPLFNAGRGSALNNKGEVEMDASIMNGENLEAGAVALVRKVKNPISLARHIMEKTPYVLVSSPGAEHIAMNAGLRCEAGGFFVTAYQFELFRQQRDKAILRERLESMHGTVGAVAIDSYGNLAAGTSTGGAAYCDPGRVSDSCIPGAGCYANNRSCAVSATGDGEYIMRAVVGHTISALVEFRSYNIQEACDLVVHKRMKQYKLRGDTGVIAVDQHGNLGISFNSERMHRGIVGDGQPLTIKIYK